MDYSGHYDRLMKRARARAQTRAQAVTALGYVERHRIVPGCIGGKYTSENIAFLTGEEHYVAHQLLVKMHPSNVGLITAAVRMAHQTTGNKSYGWLRRRMSERMKGHALFGPSKKGVPHTKEHVERQAAATRGQKRGPMSDEQKAIRSAAKKGKPHSPEHLANLRAALKIKLAGNTHSKGKKYPPRSAEHCRKLSEAHLRRRAIA